MTNLEMETAEELQVSGHMSRRLPQTVLLPDCQLRHWRPLWPPFRPRQKGGDEVVRVARNPQQNCHRPFLRECGGFAMPVHLRSFFLQMTQPVHGGGTVFTEAKSTVMPSKVSYSPSHSYCSNIAFSDDRGCGMWCVYRLKKHSSCFRTTPCSGTIFTNSETATLELAMLLVQCW